MTPTPPGTSGELLPCPFCGSSDIDPEGVACFKKEHRTAENTWHNATPDKIENRPACVQCDATTNGDWNTRTTERKEAPDEAGLLDLVESAIVASRRKLFVNTARDEAQAVVAAIRPHLAPDTEVLDALAEARDELAAGIETEGPMEAEHSVSARKLVARISAILKARGR